MYEVKGGGFLRPITIHVKKRKLRACKMIVLGVFILAAALMVEQRMRPMIETVAAYQSQINATRNINNAVLDIIREEDLQYNDIVTIRQGTDGQVASLTTDMVAMNRLKASITNRVTEYLEQETLQTFRIPLGSLLGGSVFSGRGPIVEFKLMPISYVETELYNDFQSAGINQTLHRIMLSVKVRVSAVVPFYTVATDVNTSLCLAETMIVGKVPSAFTDINGDLSPLINQYSDYHASEGKITPN